MKCDNLKTTYLFANPVFHTHIKHVEIDFHFIYDMVTWKELQISFITSDDRIVSMLINPFSSS